MNCATGVQPHFFPKIFQNIVNIVKIYNWQHTYTLRYYIQHLTRINLVVFVNKYTEYVLKNWQQEIYPYKSKYSGNLTSLAAKWWQKYFVQLTSREPNITEHWNSKRLAQAAGGQNHMLSMLHPGKCTAVQCYKSQRILTYYPWASWSAEADKTEQKLCWLFKTERTSMDEELLQCVEKRLQSCAVNWQQFQTRLWDDFVA